MNSRPYGPLGPLGLLQGKVGPIERMVTSRCPIDLDGPICPMGIGSPDRPVGACGASPPSGALGPLGDLGGPVAQDRSIQLGRAPGIGHMPRIGPIWLAVRAARRGPWGPTGPWVAWAFYRARLGAAP